MCTSILDSQSAGNIGRVALADIVIIIKNIYKLQTTKQIAEHVLFVINLFDGIDETVNVVTY
jgi:hypothetical protein